MQRYAERVWPGPGVWAAGSALVIGLALVALPLGRPAALGTALVAVAALVAALVAWSPRIEAGEGCLRIGGEVLRAEGITEVSTLDPAQMRLARGPQLDARTRTVLRPGALGGLRVSADGRTWLVTCRRPDLVAAALAEHTAEHA